MKKSIALVLAAAFVFTSTGSVFAFDAENEYVLEEETTECLEMESLEETDEILAEDYSEPVEEQPAEEQTVVEDYEFEEQPAENADEILVEDYSEFAEETAEKMIEDQGTESEEENRSAEEELETEITAADETEEMPFYGAEEGGVLAEGTYGDINWKIVQDGESADMIISGNGKIMDGFLGALFEGSEMLAYNTSVGKDIAEIVINDGITEIGAYFFEYSQYTEALLKITIPESVKTIDAYAFNANCGLTSVYYVGSRASWEQINIGEANDYLTGAQITYGKTNEQKQTGWVNKDGAWMYYTEGEITRGWVYEGENQYYMNLDGIMQTGWQYIDNNWYYLGSNGQMWSGGWKYIDDDWYYLSADGEVQTGWQYINGYWYYFGAGGRMWFGGWKYIDNDWYYLGAGGKVQTGWQYINGYWYYFGAGGRMWSGGWKYIDNDWYYLGAEIGRAHV